MGYHIDFVFGGDVVRDQQDVVSRFGAAGAELIDPHDPSWPRHPSLAEMRHPKLRASQHNRQQPGSMPDQR